jgi:hypothetical protein
MLATALAGIVLSISATAQVYESVPASSRFLDTAASDSVARTCLDCGCVDN